MPNVRVIRSGMGKTCIGEVCADIVPPQAALRESLRTGCVFEEQSPQTWGVLVTRAKPRRGMQTRIHAWWPHLAPSLELLRPQAVADRDLGWQVFARRYREELEMPGWPVRLRALLQLSLWLTEYPSVTLLSFEGTRGHSESEVHSQRRVLWSWLLGEEVQLVPFSL
jgi:uncharacterized protein YeaO (DUF488 family)